MPHKQVDPKLCEHVDCVVFDFDAEYAVRHETMPPERIRELFDYDPETGNLLWRKPTSNTVKVGDVAGTMSGEHRRINIDSKTYQAARLVWVHQNGEWPRGHVVPKDNDPGNTRIENLFEQSVSATNAARGVGKNNTSGRIGVGFNARRQKWKAWVRRDGQLYHLGYFENFDDAVAARAAAESTFVAGAELHVIKGAANQAATERRQRVVWGQLQAGHLVHAWPTFEAFAADIGPVLNDGQLVVPIDPAHPIGPQNYRWFIPPGRLFDSDTPEGKTQVRRIHRQRHGARYERKYALRKLYGLTPEQYDAKVAAQGGVCALCGEDRVVVRQEGTTFRSLYVDHDHDTGLLRDLLCSGCNKALGCFHDNPKLMRAAADYIERHRERHAEILAAKGAAA